MNSESSFIASGPAETVGRAADVLARLEGTFGWPLRSLEGLDVAAFRFLFLLPTLGILTARNVLIDSNKNKKVLVNFDPKMCKVGWRAQPVSAGWVQILNLNTVLAGSRGGVFARACKLGF